MKFQRKKEFEKSQAFFKSLGSALLADVKAALHIPRFERAAATTKIDSCGSDCKRPRWELNSFLLPKRPKIGRL